QPAPGQRTGAATSWTLLRVDQEAQAPLEIIPWEHLWKVDVGRCGRGGRLQKCDLDCAHVVLRHFRYRFRTEDLDAADLAVVQQHLQERDIVTSSAVEPAAAHEKLWFLRNSELHRFKRSILFARVDAHQPGPLIGADDE